MNRTALLYDVHVPYHSKEAYNLALDYLKGLKPKVNNIILAGDYADFYKISYWKSDPARLEFEQEIMQVRKELHKIKKMFPRTPVTYLEGNHEQRLYSYCRDKAPDLLFNNKIDKLLDLNRRQIKYVSNIDRMCSGKLPLQLGKLYVLHGHEKKVSFGALNLARLYYLRSKVNVIAGHHHRSDFALFRKLDGKHEGAWSVGALCKLSEPYMPINEWNHGFAYVDVEKDGMFTVHNKIILEGKVVST